MRSQSRCQRVVLPAVVALAALVALPAVVDARPRPSRGKRFTANKGFGLGLMLGAPTGLSGKYYFAGDRAIDFGVGLIRRYRHRDGTHVHIDYLFHPVSLVSVDPFELPLYFGLGARLFDFDDDDNDHGLGLGVRAPVGVAFDFNRVPLDIFVELAFVLDFVVDHRDDYYSDLNGAVGFRYYFN